MSHITVQLTHIGGRDPPYDHNYLLGGAVYRLLNESSQDAAKTLHDSPFRTSYVLSEIYRVSGKKGEAWFRIGTGYDRVLEIINKSMVAGIKIQVGEAAFRIIGTSVWDFPAHSGEYLTLSPILLKDKGTGLSLVYDSPNFVPTLESAINSQIENYLKRVGTVKVKHFESLAVRKRTIKERVVLAQKARLFLEGKDDELKFLVDYGIGLSPALGFGMVVPTEAGSYD